MERSLAIAIVDVIARMTKEEFKREMKRRRQEHLILEGYTFPYKDEIKKLGGVWDNREKVWLMPSLEDIRDLSRKLKIRFEETRYGYYVPKPRSSGPGDQWKSRPRSGSGGGGGGGKATPKQVDFAEKLVRKIINFGSWEDTDMGQGMQPPRRRELEKMSKREISDFIDELKQEF